VSPSSGTAEKEAQLLIRVDRGLAPPNGATGSISVESDAGTAVIAVTLR
jgi:hypothetical protein